MHENDLENPRPPVHSPADPPVSTAPAQPGGTLLEVRDLRTYFFTDDGVARAVDGVSFTVASREVLGLVGESGCGKSTLGQTLFRLVPARSGEIYFEDENVLTMAPKALTRFRQKSQFIFQDQYGCMNPRMTVGQIIAEPLLMREQGRIGRTDLVEEVARLLEAVNLDPDAMVKFPNEFSGGQARRIGVARAIALNPVFIMADEPTSGLDISTAATTVSSNILFASSSVLPTPWALMSVLEITQ